MTGAFVLRRPAIPGVSGYAVVSVADGDGREATTDEIAALLAHAHVLARRLSMARFGHPEGYALQFNGVLTRRRPWPHVHIVLADSIPAKRRAILALSLKHLLRPGRWRAIRALTRSLQMPALALSLEPTDLP